MKTCRRVRFGTAFLLLAALSLAQQRSGSKPAPAVASIDQVLSQIQKGLDKVQVELDKKQFPPFKSVTLTLQTEYSGGGAGKLNLWFVSLGGGASKTNSQQLTLVLKPASSLPVAEVAEENLDQTLASAIMDAAGGIANAKSRKPPLRLDSFKLELKFTIELKGNAGAQLKFTPVGGELSGNLDQKTVHSMVIEFGSGK